MHKKKITTKSEKETFKFGEGMAKKIKQAMILGLAGDLGAGKTQFVKGLAKGLGVKDNITSPTFVLLREYKIKDQFTSTIERSQQKIKQLVHIDCYRVTNAEDLLNLGLQELIDEGKSIIVIEWADKVKKILPKNTVWIEFTEGKKEKERKIEFKKIENVRVL
ncbi:MAG: tRNA (adenosine(37)-N6)-threonylcarbamoyltransferase complex ATPase subunit type 1 TsaE [Candidatus Kuenenbacteria bacterium]